MIYNKNGGPSVIRTPDLPIMSSRHSAEPLQQDEEKKEIISRVMVGTTETEPMPNLVVGRAGWQ